jgi:uncharacterized membrane protein
MKKFIRVVQAVFGVPWLVFGIQHFMYADFVASLVPSYFPARLFFAYFTGAAMFAAGVSLIVNVKARLAATLLCVMLLMFVLMIHIPKLVADATVIMTWTRALQDIAIASAAFMLAGALSKQDLENGALKVAAKLSFYTFAVLLVVFGFHQFFNLDFLPAKAAPYLPLRVFWVWITGVAMVATTVSVFIGKKTSITAFALGIWMLILNLLLHVYLLATAPFNPVYWTGAMLEMAITCGVFVFAFTSIQMSTNSKLATE